MRECAVCRERILPRVGLRSQGWRKNDLDEHIRENHHNYWSWNRKTSYYYLIPIALFLAGSFQAALLLLNGNSSASLIPVIVILFPWLTALLLAASILSVKARGKQQFRVLWFAEHRYPVT